MRDRNYTTQGSDPVAHNGFMPETRPPVAIRPHDLSGRSFSGKFGLHPGMALLTVGVDTMLFASDIATAGFIIPLTLAVAAGLGVITFMAQRKWYGDDMESAFIKAAIVAGLTAIPTSLPGFLCAPAGVVGLFHRKRG